VMTSVKKTTDELLITHRRNFSVGKTVKSCSMFWISFEYFFLIYIYI
jgi:hypothetical protein